MWPMLSHLDMHGTKNTMDNSMEDLILIRVDIARELSKLSTMDCVMIELIYHHRRPEDWTASWPPKYADIGIYIGVKFENKPLSEAAIRYRRDKIKEKWQENYIEG